MKRLAFSLLLMLVTFAFAAAAQAQVSYPGNGGTGFGGTIGQGSLTLSNDNTTLFGSITTNGSGFNDILVIYIDSVSGGFNTTANFTDQGDGHRRAISGFNGGTERATLNFATGFAADYAIALNPSFAGLWDLEANAAHNFLQSANVANPGTNTYTFSVSLANLGLQVGDTFRISTTYISSTAYRSNEAFNAITGSPADASGNFGRNTATADFQTYTVVPEPGTYAAGALALFGLAFVQRRRLRALLPSRRAC